MLTRLSPEEDLELRQLAHTASTTGLSAEEQRRLAALRVRDRRSDVRPLDGPAEVLAALPRQVDRETAEVSPAYRLSRRFIDLVIARGGVQVVLLLAINDNPSYDELIGALPHGDQPYARELLDAIEGCLLPG